MQPVTNTNIYSMGTVSLPGSTTPGTSTITPNTNTNVITSSSIKPITNPVPLVGNKVDTSSYASKINSVVTDLTNGVNVAQQNVDALNSKGKTESDAIANLQSLLGGKSADTSKIYNESGITALYNQLSDLNAQATGLKNEAEAIPIQIQNEFKGTGATYDGVAPIQTSRLRDNALKALSLGQQASIASAQYDKAKNYADQIIDAKYSQIEADIKSKLTNLSSLRDFELTPAQEKLRLATEKQTKIEDQQLADAKTREKEISNMIIQASSQNAPLSVLNRAKELQSKGASSAEVSIALGQYGGDYYKTELLKQQIETEKVQRSKISNDMRLANIKSDAVNITGRPVKVSNSEITDLNEAIRAKNSVESLINQFKQNIADNGTQVLYGKDAGDRDALKTNLLLEMKSLAKTGALDQGTIDVLSGTIPENTFWATAGAQTAALDKLLSTVNNKTDEYVKSYRGTTAETDPRTSRAFVVENKPNPFQQALGGGSTLNIPGTSIINGITNNGIDFAIPTSTAKKI